MKRSLLSLRLPLTLASILPFFALAPATSAESEELEPWQKAQKTEVWEPVPPVVTVEPGQAPSDAIVLFDGSDLDHWETSEGGPAEWTLEDNAMTVAPGAGGIQTKKSFCDVQLHIEWRSPTEIEGLTGQQRGNSGVFFQQRYEIQVLDSYENETYSNGQAASLYKQSIPLANASRAPGEWETYDIVFMAPRFTANGNLKKPGTVTVLHNGVLVQNHTEIRGTTEWIGEPEYEAHECAPLALQDHGDEVSFRNIWIREL